MDEYLGMKTISLSEVIGELDVKIRDGKRNVFSIAFVIESTGELRFFKRAIATGLRHINLKSRAMRGIMPVNINGNGVDHRTPCNIYGIVIFNGKIVKQ